MNLVGVDLERSNGEIVARFGDNWLAVDGSSALEPFMGKRVILGIRPEHIEDATLAPEAPDGRRLGAVVDIREDLGSDIYVHFAVGGPPVRGRTSRPLSARTRSKRPRRTRRRRGTFGSPDWG
jgi:multiple sugar transport system ATP-binding protein